MRWEGVCLIRVDLRSSGKSEGEKIEEWGTEGCDTLVDEVEEVEGKEMDGSKLGNWAGSTKSMLIISFGSNKEQL